MEELEKSKKKCTQEGSAFTRCFGKGDWEKFGICYVESAHLVTLEKSIEECRIQVEHI